MSGAFWNDAPRKRVRALRHFSRESFGEVAVVGAVGTNTQDGVAFKGDAFEGDVTAILKASHFADHDRRPVSTLAVSSALHHDGELHLTLRAGVFGLGSCFGDALDKSGAVVVGVTPHVLIKPLREIIRMNAQNHQSQL